MESGFISYHPPIQEHKKQASESVVLLFVPTSTFKIQMYDFMFWTHCLTCVILSSFLSFKITVDLYFNYFLQLFLLKLPSCLELALQSEKYKILSKARQDVEWCPMPRKGSFCDHSLLMQLWKCLYYTRHS